jgi:hypothetical protein
LKIAAHISILNKGNKKLETIKLASKTFNKHDDELWHNAHLYDIVSYTVVNDTVIVSVLHDNKEEMLSGIINDCFSSNNSFYAGNGQHATHKHFYNPNDVKCLPERISILSKRYDPLTFCTAKFLLPISGNTDADGPPPRV